MADDLESRILGLFQSQNDQPLQTSDITKRFNVHKKQINVILYKLKRQNILDKIQDVPPVWTLSANHGFSGYGGYSVTARSNYSRPQGQASRGRKAHGVKHFSFGKRKSTNKAGPNKELMKQIVLLLQQNDDPLKSIDIAKSMGKRTSSDINPSIYFLGKQNILTQVTDQPATWIINPEYKQPGSFILGNSVLELTNQNVCTGMTSESNNDVVGYQGCVEQEQMGQYPIFGSMKTLDDSLKLGTQNSPNIDIENLQMNSPSQEFSYNSQENETDNEIDLNIDPSFDSELSQNEAMQTEEYVSETESQNIIIPETEDQEDIFQDLDRINKFCDSISKEFGPLDEGQDIEKPPKLSKTDLEDMEETSGLDDETQIKEDEGQSSEILMTESDEVLKALLTCPMQTTKSFILERKMKIPKDKLEELLDECKSYKYVSFHDTMWIMTKSGEEYIKDKLSKLGVETNSGAQTHSSPLPLKPQKSPFKGPPPPPRALLQKENPVSSESKAFSNLSTSHIHFSSSSSSSMFGQNSMASNFVTQTLNQQPFSSSTGPVPLMSLTTSRVVNTQNAPQLSSTQYETISHSSHDSLQPMGNSTSVGGPVPLMSVNVVAPPISDTTNRNSAVGGFPMPGSQNSEFNIFSNRSDQVNQMLNKGNTPSFISGPNAQNSSMTFAQSGQSKVSSIQSDTGSTRSTTQSLNSGPAGEVTVSLTGHTKTEHLPAYAKQLLNSFSTGSTRSPMNSKAQLLAGLNRSGDSRFPVSRMQTSSSSSRSSGTSSGFKPPPSPLDLIKQRAEQSGGGPQSMSRYPQSSVKQDLAQTAQQMIQSSGMSRPIVKSNSSPLLMQQAVNQMQNMRAQGQPGGQPQSLPVRSNTAHVRQKSGPASLDLTSESFAAVNKNPVSALMEYAQSRHKEARIDVINQSGPSHRPKFMMAVFVGDQQIASTMCTNKKDGRREVADKALRALIASGQYNAQSTPAAKPLVPAANMTHFDKIAALSHQAFNALVAGISENFAGRKVIAALVMKCSDTDVGTVVSVGSGNRCITGQQLSLEGNTINDSHAEIITRRGFIRFLYRRLLAYNPENTGDMFERGPSGKLRLRKGITLHLYISTAPCGDGALFSPRDAANTGPIMNVNDRTHNPTFTTQAQGLVRTKMEGGEGTIPVEKDFKTQTFDGIQRGERLRTMSCTDKICRWNVVGMQGALLSHFLEPIYLDSLTLGLLYDHGHLARAICCRVNRGEPNVDELLPTGYHLNHPWLGRVTACEPPREVQKTKALSINWSIGDERAEVTDGTLGLLYTKIEKGMFSRCSKKNFYDSFKQLCQKFGIQHLLQAQNYNEAKMMATDFQRAKAVLLKKFKENGYGIWVSKPVEEELFN